MIIFNSLSGNIDAYSSHDTYYTIRVNERKIFISDSKLIVREYANEPQIKTIKTLITEVNSFISKNKTAADRTYGRYGSNR